MAAKPKPIRKCLHKIFNKTNKIWWLFLILKIEYVIKYSFFIFVQIFTPKSKTYHDMKIWMFPITLLHFERIAWIFVYKGALTIFGEGSFVFNFNFFFLVSYGLVTKSVCMYKQFRRWLRKQNVIRWMCILLQAN